MTVGRVGIGIGVAAATAGTLAWSKVTYDDAVHDRNNDRNSLVNIGLWVGTVGAGAAGAVAHLRSNRAMPWLYAASALMGVNAFASAATAENGWDRSDTPYCNYGFCNRAARTEHGIPSIYLGKPNPLDAVDTDPTDQPAT